jgi:site-specific DNA recombinase
MGRAEIAAVIAPVLAVSPRAAQDATKRVRCALYVRKSTEVDEEQGFNSLEAQRLACEDYVRSRVGENWTALPEQYTDGGWSGATVKRPAFQRLLADIQAQKIDCVVVHRVDRLSRSLLDFARLMHFFQEHGVAFVSVTQNFTTADPVGRLTLNLLATFSEFEREMIVARTRDKVAAARRKGRWTGGVPVLGYDVDPRGGRIHLNEAEAVRVREIFALYLRERSLTRVVEELGVRGWTTKTWIRRDGVLREGSSFDKPSLLRLLKNPLFVGKVHHRGSLHPGEQPAIVDDITWNDVQTLLRRNGSVGYEGPRTKHHALLKGLLFCGQCGSAMTPTWTEKGGRRYRYYRCLSTIKKGAHACPTGSVPAVDLERQVVERIREIERDPELIAEVILQARHQRDELIARLKAEAKHLRAERGRKTSLARVPGRAGAIEARLEDIQREVRAAKGARIQEEGIRSALESFGPVWEPLWPMERARIFNLIVDRIDYEGRGEGVAVRFRSHRTPSSRSLKDAISAYR